MSPWQPISALPDNTRALCRSPGKKGAGNKNAAREYFKVDSRRERSLAGRLGFYYEYPEAPYTHFMLIPEVPDE